MCKVSDKIKLCTCSSDINRLKHYWILHRFFEGKDWGIVGLTVMPFDIGEKSNESNWSLLEALLNEGDIFDVKMDLVENDMLELSFQIQDEYCERINYVFSYLDGRWHREDNNCMDFADNYVQENYGKIKNPLVNKKSK